MKIQTIYLLSLFTILENAHGGNISTKEAKKPVHFAEDTYTTNIHPGKLPTGEPFHPSLLVDKETIRLMELENMIPIIYDLTTEKSVRICPIKGIKNHIELLEELKEQIEEQQAIMTNTYKKKDRAFIQQNIAKLKKAIEEVTPKRDEEIRSAAVTTPSKSSDKTQDITNENSAQHIDKAATCNRIIKNKSIDSQVPSADASNENLSASSN